jgi:uncharacterized Ntn-hydrolase superfamily protein
MTFSIIARAPDAALFGIALASSSPAVGARCAHARARIGAIATQNITDPALGPHLLDTLASGASAQQALAAALSGYSYADFRQLVVIGPAGAPAVHCGRLTLPVSGAALGEHAAAAGNLLAHSDVPRAMIEAFAAPPTGAPAASPTVAFGTQLLHALRAGLECGGEAGVIHSAALLVVREVSWPVVDLRVDWSDEPLEELQRLWAHYAPQIEDYVVRALDPRRAPSFGVPGDL